MVCRDPGRLDTDRHGAGRGRVIPHANRFEASTAAAVALPVTVVEPTFGTQTMAAAGAPMALGARLDGAAAPDSAYGRGPVGPLV